MAAVIPSKILDRHGQCVKAVDWDAQGETLVFHCDRNRRFVPVDHCTGGVVRSNRRLRQRVQDLPL